MNNDGWDDIYISATTFTKMTITISTMAMEHLLKAGLNTLNIIAASVWVTMWQIITTTGNLM